MKNVGNICTWIYSRENETSRRLATGDKHFNRK